MTPLLAAYAYITLPLITPSCFLSFLGGLFYSFGRCLYAFRRVYDAFVTRPFFDFVEKFFDYRIWDRSGGPGVLLAIGASYSLNLLDDFLPVRVYAPRLLLAGYLCGLAALLARRSVYRCHFNIVYLLLFISLLLVC